MFGSRKSTPAPACGGVASGCKLGYAFRRTVVGREGTAYDAILLPRCLTVAIAGSATEQDPKRIRQEGTPAEAMRQQCREQIKAIGMRGAQAEKWRASTMRQCMRNGGRL